MTYREECLTSSFEEHGIVASKKQIELVAADIQYSYENYGLIFHTLENPLTEELKQTRSELQKEKNKIGCPICKGRSLITTGLGTRTGNNPCWKCNGEGKY